jgi:hypothetical protein
MKDNTYVILHKFSEGKRKYFGDIFKYELLFSISVKWEKKWQKLTQHTLFSFTNTTLIFLVPSPIFNAFSMLYFL